MPKPSKKPHAPRRPPPIHPSPSPIHHSPPTAWSHVADWYDQLVGDQGSEYHQQVIIPGILRLLDHPQNRTRSVNEGGPLLPSQIPNPQISNLKSSNPKSQIPPLHILDLACGQGVLSRKLASIGGGGHTVTALDAAPPLIAAAQKRNALDHLPITYHIADATKLLRNPAPSPPFTIHHSPFTIPLTPASFDAALCILAIQNMTPLSPIWQAVHTALKPKGSLILVMMHPCFRIPQHSDWHWNPATHQQARLIYDYLTSAKIQIVTHPGQQNRTRSVSEGPQPASSARPTGGPSTPHFHRPLQAYINTLGNSGLLIDHLEEWPSHKSSQPGPKKAALDHSRKEIPLFLALRARKV